MDTQFYIKDNVIRERHRIVIVKDGLQTVNPTEEMVLADGWQPYTPPEPQPTIDDQLRELLLEQYNRRGGAEKAAAGVSMGHLCRQGAG